MNQFNYTQYLKENPLMRELSEDESITAPTHDEEKKVKDVKLTVKVDGDSVIFNRDDKGTQAKISKEALRKELAKQDPMITIGGERVRLYNSKPKLEKMVSGVNETDGYGSYKNPGTMLEFDDQDDFYINVSVRDASKALDILRDEFSNEIQNKIIQLDGSDSYVINDREVAMDLFDALKEQGIEIIDTDVEVDDSDFDGYDELGPDEELMEGMGKVDEVYNLVIQHMRSLIKKTGLDDDDVVDLRAKLADFFKQ